MAVYTFPAFAERLLGVGEEVAHLSRPSIEQASLLMKRNILAAAPSRLRGVGKKGAKLGVGYTITEGLASSESVVRSRGPWQLIERDTKKHDIPGQKTKRGKRRGLPVVNGNPYSIVHHPGTHGKHIFEKAVFATMPQVNALFAEEMAAVLRSAL